MKSCIIFLFFISLFIVVGVVSVNAQKTTELAGRTFAKYDNRMIDYNRKAIFEIKLNAAISLDPKPEEGVELDGNIAGGRYNYGFGIDIARFNCTQQSQSVFKAVNDFGYGVYYGAGYEFIPNRCHKAKIFVGHKSGLFWGYVNFLNQLDLMFEDDINSEKYRLYMRLHFMQIRINKLSLDFGMQGTMQEAYDFWPVRNENNFQDFDQAMMFLQMSYSIQPRKW